MKLRFTHTGKAYPPTVVIRHKVYATVHYNNVFDCLAFFFTFIAVFFWFYIKRIF